MAMHTPESAAASFAADVPYPELSPINGGPLGEDESQSKFKIVVASIVSAAIVSVPFIFRPNHESAHPKTDDEIEVVVDDAALSFEYEAIIEAAVYAQELKAAEEAEAARLAEEAQKAQEEAAAVAQAASQQPVTYTASAPSSSCNGDTECFLACTRSHESDTSGGYSAVSSSGTYRGAYQFQQSTWDAAVAGAGHDEYVGVPADQVPPEIQDAAAAHLYQASGTGPWNGRC
jgi:hypothetical protein